MDPNCIDDGNIGLPSVSVKYIPVKQLEHLLINAKHSLKEEQKILKSRAEIEMEYAASLRDWAFNTRRKLDCCNKTLDHQPLCVGYLMALDESMATAALHEKIAMFLTDSQGPVNNLKNFRSSFFKSKHDLDIPSRVHSTESVLHHFDKILKLQKIAVKDCCQYIKGVEHATSEICRLQRILEIKRDKLNCLMSICDNTPHYERKIMKAKKNLLDVEYVLYAAISKRDECLTKAKKIFHDYAPVFDDGVCSIRQWEVERIKFVIEQFRDALEQLSLLGQEAAETCRRAIHVFEDIKPERVVCMWEEERAAYFRVVDGDLADRADKPLPMPYDLDNASLDDCCIINDMNLTEYHYMEETMYPSSGHVIKRHMITDPCQYLHEQDVMQHRPASRPARHKKLPNFPQGQIKFSETNRRPVSASQASHRRRSPTPTRNQQPLTENFQLSQHPTMGQSSSSGAQYTYLPSYGHHALSLELAPHSVSPSSVQYAHSPRNLQYSHSPANTQQSAPPSSGNQYSHSPQVSLAPPKTPHSMPPSNIQQPLPTSNIERPVSPSHIQDSHPPGSDHSFKNLNTQKVPPSNNQPTEPFRSTPQSLSSLDGQQAILPTTVPEDSFQSVQYSLPPSTDQFSNSQLHLGVHEDSRPTDSTDYSHPRFSSLENFTMPSAYIASSPPKQHHGLAPQVSYLSSIQQDSHPSYVERIVTPSFLPSDSHPDSHQDADEYQNVQSTSGEHQNLPSTSNGYQQHQSLTNPKLTQNSDVIKNSIGKSYIENASSDGRVSPSVSTSGTTQGAKPRIAIDDNSNSSTSSDQKIETDTSKKNNIT